MSGSATLSSSLLALLLAGSACIRADAVAGAEHAPDAGIVAATALDRRVTFTRLDRDASALLARGNVWDSPSLAVDRPRSERATLQADGTLTLASGALLVAQFPGRILGELEVEIEGVVEGHATVRLSSIFAPLPKIGEIDALDEALVQRIHLPLLERDWSGGSDSAPTFRSGWIDGDPRTTWLLLSIEVAVGSRVQLARARLSQSVVARPDHHSVGAESRLSLPVAIGAPHRFELPALPAGARVELAIAAPEGMVTLHTPLRVTCRLAGATPIENAIELRDGPLADEEPVRRWHDLAFDITQAQPAGGLLEVIVEGAAGRACLVGLPSVQARRDESTPLDLILISLDTLRADRVGALGSTRGLTPHLDRFAQRCVRFTRAYSPANFTIPAHGSMMTGLQPLVHGAFRFGERVSIRAWPNVAEACAAAGMATAAFTGGGFVDAAFGFDRGFARYKMLDALMTPRNLRWSRSPRKEMPAWNAAVRDGVSLAEVTGWIEQHTDRRSFLFFHTYHAHDYSPEPATARARGLDETSPWPTPIDLQARDFSAVKPGSAQLAHYEALYDATVTEVDAAIGALLETLERSGALEHTAVVITADHGEGFLEHGFLFHTVGLHDEVVRVPLLIHAPGLMPRAVDTPVSLVDVAPTLRELAGLAPFETTQGKSLVPLLRGEEMAPRPLLIQDCPSSGETHSALVMGRFKYLRRMRLIAASAHGADVFSGAGQRPQEMANEQLYDLLEDPGELRNLAAEAPFAAMLAQARVALDRLLAEVQTEAERLAAWRTANGVHGADLDAELANLGYGR